MLWITEDSRLSRVANTALMSGLFGGFCGFLELEPEKRREWGMATATMAGGS